MSASNALSAEELRRLSIVRHLYGIGIFQSRGADPTAGLSILPFHDAAEAFLQLACERCNAGENKADFMQYWKLLADKSIDLPHRETMRRLSAARRGLKHQGILPAHVEIEGFRAAVTNFLYDSTPIVFSVGFDQISLVGLVADPETREKLREAYDAFEARDYETTLGLAAEAFILMRRARNRARALLLPPNTPASLWSRATRHSSSSFALSGIEDALGPGVASSLQRILERNNSAIETISEAIELGNAGIGLNEYMLFEGYTPVVHQFIGGNLQVEWTKEPTADPEIVSRCLDFVVTAAVRYGA